MENAGQIGKSKSKTGYCLGKGIKWQIFFCGVLVMCSYNNGTNNAYGGENLKCLSEKNDKVLHDKMIEQIKEQFERRRETVEKVYQTEGGIVERKKELRKQYLSLLGELPEKTALNPKVTGVIECDGYRIEKVVYESLPNHHVTANIYIPTVGKGPYPGVLFIPGHHDCAKTYIEYQSTCILMAKNGLVSLIADPISQGERAQIFDGIYEGGCPAHTLLGLGGYLVGTPLVAWEAWDNVRSVDYLLSRPEVDKTKKVGCTGHSGGGTETTYLMALDERIGPAAPSCYLMERKITVHSEADACQHLPGEGVLGIEPVDYVAMHAPEPTLILAAKKDFFDINATRSLFMEAQKIYSALGVPDRVDMFENDHEHAIKKADREKDVQWMRRWLLDDNSPIVEPNLTIQKDEDLQVTKRGQVKLEWKDEVTVADLNLKRAKELSAEREKFWKENSKEECIGEVKRLIGFKKSGEKAVVENAGTIQRWGYRVEKLVIRRAGEIAIPGLLFVPEAPGRYLHGFYKTIIPGLTSEVAADKKWPVTLYVDGRGKEADAAQGDAIDRLVRQGRMVLAIDVRGVGETGDYSEYNSMGGYYWNDECRNVIAATHIGHCLLGQRVEDVLAAVDLLFERNDVDKNSLQLMGIERGGPIALHAAAIDNRFGEVVIKRSITSWIDVVAAPMAPNQMTNLVPYALTRYDLPDLVKAITPRKVQVIGPVDAYGEAK